MKYALISDIHSNLPALEAVLADIDRREDVDAVYHLGDLAGYAPWPNDVVSLVRARGIPGIAGNYDSTVAHDYEHCGCRADTPHDEELSHVSFGWTLENVTPETRRYLAELPFRMDLRPAGGHASRPQVILVHGAPTLNTLYWTEDRPDSFSTKMATAAGAREGDLIAFGHTHKPWHREVEGVHFVNTGSVGKPKDNDPRACYVLIEAGEKVRSVEHVRLEYDVERAARAIRESELPDEFAGQLRAGGKPETADVT
ncbi:MAG: metallophosphoesterase family protein [Rubrobacter sp.]|nr:metallophosphoesterase family protein [Rubrobacter sp.]